MPCCSNSIWWFLRTRYSSVARSFVSLHRFMESLTAVVRTLARSIRPTLRVGLDEFDRIHRGCGRDDGNEFWSGRGCWCRGGLPARFPPHTLTPVQVSIPSLGVLLVLFGGKNGDVTTQITDQGYTQEQ